MIVVMQILVSVGTLLSQIILLKKMIKIRKLLRNQRMNKQKVEHKGQENTHSEIPEWVESFIDDYMINSEKGIHQ